MEGLSLEKLSEFYEKVMSQEKPKTPTLPPDNNILQRLSLIDEERAELAQACASHNLTEIADALGDLVVVCYQMAFTCGLPFDKILGEIHSSNMTKSGGHYNAAGKFVKPESYKKADIERILKEAENEKNQT